MTIIAASQPQITREVREVQYIQKQSRVYLAFHEGNQIAYRWIKAKGETALLAAVATIRTAFLEHGWEALA
jgi:hypothetical protein